jgi:hypothetical protein
MEVSESREEVGTNSPSSRSLGGTGVKLDLLMSAQAFKWIRLVSISLSVIWASMFGYLEADALNYSSLAKDIFGHFTIENVLLLCIATILGLLPFAVAIRFGDSRLCKRSLISVFQVICVSILAEDIAYFVSLGQPIAPGDWTAQLLGGFFMPFTRVFVPTWYAVVLFLIAVSQYAMSRI